MGETYDQLVDRRGNLKQVHRWVGLICEFKKKLDRSYITASLR